MPGWIGPWEIAILLVIAINAFDEDLTPEAKALLQAPPNPYKPEENLYLALIGFDAPEGESLVAAAQIRIPAYEHDMMDRLKALRSDAGSTDDKMEKTVLGSVVNQRKTAKLDFHGTVSFCQPLTKSCVAGVEAHKVEIEGLVKANQELYRRYSALRGLKGYYETRTSTHRHVRSRPRSVTTKPNFACVSGMMERGWTRTSCRKAGAPDTGGCPGSVNVRNK